MDYTRTNLKWNGWGWKESGFEFEAGEEFLWEFMCTHLGLASLPKTPSIALEDIPLPDCRLSKKQKDQLVKILDADRIHWDRFERVFHSFGRSYNDLIHLRSGKFEYAVDAVAYPTTESEVAKLVQFAIAEKMALIPFGGGSSVVGGVTAWARETHQGILTLDMTLMNKLLALDTSSMTATFQPGIYGPDLEEVLAEKGFTLGHYPQSFEFSTLGGWIAARGAGQQSDRYGKAEEFIVSAKVQTPQGEWKTLPFPASAAGPSLNQLIAGSEGIFGVITEVTVHLHHLPQVKDYRGFLFPNFEKGKIAAQQIVQAELPLAMMRLSDEDESRFLFAVKDLGKPTSVNKRTIKKLLSMTGYETPSIMLIGVEGEKLKTLPAMAEITAICLKNAGLPIGAKAGKSWYKGRFHMPYLRDPMMDRGLAVDTLETCTEWSNIHTLHQEVKKAISSRIEKSGRKGIVFAHISHSYHNGSSLYYTFVFPRDTKNEIKQWREIKAAASQAIVKNGGTISHHHGVGQDHLPWLKPELGELGLGVLKAVKSYLDPQDIMNPGKLI